jgi:hypothetical protein
MEVIIKLTYIYGTVTALIDVAYGVLVAILTWNLKVDRRTKMLIVLLLAMACIYVKRIFFERSDANKTIERVMLRSCVCYTLKTLERQTFCVSLYLLNYNHCA